MYTDFPHKLTNRFDEEMDANTHRRSNVRRNKPDGKNIEYVEWLGWLANIYYICGLMGTDGECFVNSLKFAYYGLCWVELTYLQRLSAIVAC